MRRSYVMASHPRAESLRVREQLVAMARRGVVAPEGLLAHGRGEAFDYILGEKTNPFALEAMKAAAASLLLARHPVISVNGNAAALASKDIVHLSKIVDAPMEVNLFHRSSKRERKIAQLLRKHGATRILGVGRRASAVIPEIQSMRRRVDPQGILKADVVLVPLEDGDRTEALRKLGKTVISIDLNPLSRTSRAASISIVDNLVRAMPRLRLIASQLKPLDEKRLKRMMVGYTNSRALAEAVLLLSRRLGAMARRRVTFRFH